MAAGFGDPNENIPLAGVVVVDGAADEAAGFAPKLNADAAAGLLLESVPKPTVGVALLVSAVVAAGFPKVIGEDSAGFGAAAVEGEPKLNPPVLGVSFFCGESVAGLLAPNEKPPEPKVGAGLGSSFFSVDLLSVVSAAGFAPKLNPVEGAAAGVFVAVVLLLLPNANLGLSSELGATAGTAGLLPKLKPPEVGAVVELEAGTPNENPVFGASLLESASFGTPKLNPELVVDAAAAGLLPNEKDGASDGVDPGLACSQQAHLLRVASLRVMQALHSHLPAACCATKLLKPWSDGGVAVAAGIENIDLMAAGTAEATAAAAVGFAPGFGLLQQTQLLLSASLRVMQSAHSHRADCCATRALKPASAGAVAAVSGLTTAAATAGFAPGLGVSHATHLLLSGSFRTIQASHSHLFEPVSLNALPNPALAAAGAAGFNASKQLPVFNSGTGFRASKQLPLLSGSGAFAGLTSFAGVTLVFTLAVSGLNWKPVSFVGAAVAATLFPTIGSGLLNLKLLSVAGFEVSGRFSFAGEENL